MTLAERYQQAIDSFVEKIRPDPNVLAVIIYGSVVHGNPWEKSDIDTIVVVRDQKLTHTHYGIYEDNILLNVDLCPRSDLKRQMEKNTGGGVAHSMNATSRVVYTTDETFYDYFEECKDIGERDREKSIFAYTNWLLGLMEKVEKWLVVKKNPLYARYFLLKAADSLASIEVVSQGVVPTREAICQAESLNPALMERFYRFPMTHDLSSVEVGELLSEMDTYIKSHLDAILSVATEFFGDGEIKTGTQITSHFKEPIHYMHPILDFLCDNGYLEKLTQTIRLTPKSKLAVEEVAFWMPNH